MMRAAAPALHTAAVGADLRLDAPDDDDTLFAGLDQGVTADRIWRGFMTARLMLSLMLLALHSLTLWFVNTRVTQALWGLCVFYAAATLAARLRLRPVPLGTAFEAQWTFTVGLDIAVYLALAWFSLDNSVNYVPLLIFPVLLCVVLGSLRLAAFTALLTLMLTGWLLWQRLGDKTDALFYGQLALFLFTVLMGALTLHRLVRQLGAQERASRKSARLARLQERVNDLVVQGVRDGVLVVNAQGRVRAANPAAHAMLQLPAGQALVGTHLDALPALAPLHHLAAHCLAEGQGGENELLLFADAPEHPTVHLLARAMLGAQPLDAQARDEPLCLLTLQDMHEVQERLRMEKLAAMGRVSAAVAHEIRNPLAAISQAAQLLDEELDSPLQKRLSHMMQDNIARLGRVVSDVLDITRVQHQPDADTAVLPLDESVKDICALWQQQNPACTSLLVHTHCNGAQVVFDLEHLRRILINLLDNALRHAAAAQPIAVCTRPGAGQRALLQVWSAGAPLQASLLPHLFEPFASGHSRSTGLGLYICRELCARNRATLHHQRMLAPHTPAQAAQTQGNAFVITIPLSPP